MLFSFRLRKFCHKIFHKTTSYVKDIFVSFTTSDYLKASRYFPNGWQCYISFTYKNKKQNWMSTVDKQTIGEDKEFTTCFYPKFNLKKLFVSYYLHRKTKSHPGSRWNFFFALFKLNITIYFKCYSHHNCSVNLNWNNT